MRLAECVREAFSASDGKYRVVGRTRRLRSALGAVAEPHTLRMRLCSHRLRFADDVLQASLLHDDGAVGARN